MSELRLAIIVGSTREGRFGPRIANWFADTARTHGIFDVDVVDLVDFDIPTRMGQGHPRQGVYSESVRPFATRIAAADSIVFVTPEYNHGYPASLKAAIDALHVEWLAKPVSFVSYGGASGGIRAIEQLRQVAAELHMVDIRETLSIPFVFGAFDADGSIKDTQFETIAKGLLDQLVWWAAALTTARRTNPYEA